MASKGKNNGPADQEDDGKEAHAPRLPRRKYGYFRDDQITVLVTHSVEQTDEKQLEGFKKYLNYALAQSQRKDGKKAQPLQKPDKARLAAAAVAPPAGSAMAEPPLGTSGETVPGRPGERKPPQVSSVEATTFPGLTQEEIAQCREFLSAQELRKASSAFSIIKCDLVNMPDDPFELVDIVEALNNQFVKDRQVPDKPSEPQDRRTAVPGPAKPGNARQGPTIEGLAIQRASLNWLASVASQGGGTGGPGGRPSAYYGSRKNAPYYFDLITELKAKNIYGDGEGVDVAILDTAPCAQDLVAAYKEWPDHPIIAKLLGPNGKLHLYPAAYKELLRLGCTSLNDHDYKMSDHGLFIAGIIHSIAPKAEIHLIEVLNQYGVGDFMSFVHGFQKIYTEHIYRKHRKLVINCSWMLDFPRDDLHCRHMDQIGDPDAEFERKVRQFSKRDETTLRLLESFFNRFFGLGREAIAAAGNDARAGDKDRAQARYPAALKRVFGVGALPKTLAQGGNNKYLSSVFSDVSDAPDKRGVANKGVVTLGGEEGEGKGVLGLYIGEFPDCRCNESKWAWWAGTSFATPILVGTVTAILSRTENHLNTTQDAIKKLAAPGVKLIKEGKANKQENALPVTQS